MATTTNFGWTTPNDTDLVKDGAAAIRTLGSSIDTSLVDLKGGTTGQVLAKASGTDLDFVWSADAAGMANPMTTTGDTIYSSSGSTPARLGIGTAGQVLKVNSGATAPEWATATAPAQNFSLINSGGTTMNGNTTVTISGISGMNELFVTAHGWSAAAGNACFLRLNTDTGNKYYYSGHLSQIFTTYTVADFGTNASGAPDAISFYQVGQISNNASSTGSFGIRISGCNSSGIKMISHASGATASSGINHQLISGNGMYSGTSTISSITIFNGSGVNFDAGTIFVYGSA